MNDYSEPAILDSQMFHSFQPMPLLKRAAPFHGPDWIFELKMDGFRALAVIEHGRAQLLSRNGHPFSFVLRTGRMRRTAERNCLTGSGTASLRFAAECESGH